MRACADTRKQVLPALRCTPSALLLLPRYATRQMDKLTRVTCAAQPDRLRPPTTTTTTAIIATAAPLFRQGMQLYIHTYRMDTRIVFSSDNKVTTPAANCQLPVVTSKSPMLYSMQKQEIKELQSLEKNDHWLCIA